MKKLLIALLAIAALNVVDASARCRTGCGRKPVCNKPVVPECYVEEIVKVPVTAECETVCWCPAGTKTAK